MIRPIRRRLVTETKAAGTEEVETKRIEEGRVEKEAAGAETEIGTKTPPDVSPAKRVGRLAEAQRGIADGTIGDATVVDATAVVAVGEDSESG